MSTRRQAHRWKDAPRRAGLDPVLLITASSLLAIGVVMVASTSIAIAESYSVTVWHFVIRHLIYVLLGVGLTIGLRVVGTRQIERLAPFGLVAAIAVLLLPFIPGLGHEVNGSTRWINLGVARFQVVEAAKLLIIVFIALYLARRPELDRRGFGDTLKPLLAAGLLGVILLKQPDMGSAVVIVAIVGGMVWLAGAAWRHLFVLGLTSLPLITVAALEPYRLQRVMTFVDPWADPFNAGFQLTQALIAVGRGQITGVGLGSSVQKLYYLPEAHTDFIFAVLAEEFGLLGIALVLVLFGLLVGRILQVGLRAQAMDRPFQAFLCWGVGLWIGIQALVSIGVNLGLLPTKGLTLPLISAGGSSLIMTILGIGLVIRVQWELQRETLSRPRRREQWAV
ncbi:putative lipid II flippase FtsW [Wenzhouxiangella limi]|uniref:Probable peptidoglycan glycosyltransferase FtsW n=1 Tax=Wenzhouxiangella limi TaxID=2707351 RepID=A0A845V944_9GAMM|nr:putative lipid II flippase FtsW [Wenzhouxiangella limi]NDY96671.1 putative lipid II flippase FtsW [Wenzhouxiangella limi]